MAELIRIVVADDHLVVRRGLATLLVARNGMEIVGEAATGQEAVDLVRTVRPDVILVDMIMPDMNGPETIERIRADTPDARVLVLSSFAESESVAAAIKAGALGYLLKDSGPDDLFHAIRSVHLGNLTLPQDLAHKLIQPPLQPDDGPLDQLTEREIAVLQLLAQGMSNREIAESLHIGTTTARTHVSNIFNKLGFSDRTKLALFAVKQGLDSPDN